MKPIIGVTASVEDSKESISRDNLRSIINNGGIPFVITSEYEKSDVYQIAKSIDGLYLTGGYDIDPTLFGEEPHPNLGIITPTRDQFEVELIKALLQMNKPILAVCRGCQILNIAMGGDMYQDIYDQINGDLLQHNQKAPKDHASHYVYVESNTLLYSLAKNNKIKVNSRHHQANRKVVSPMQVCGRASDSVIEAIESAGHSFVLGLQWHPENMAMSGDQVSINIYNAFIDTCQTRR
ncbi:gamma-glutamyl-gamma-aminobutyrate hydrolase family protein [Bacillaceae bacterium S4-13-58]